MFERDLEGSVGGSGVISASEEIKNEMKRKKKDLFFFYIEGLTSERLMQFLVSALNINEVLGWALDEEPTS